MFDISWKVVLYIAVFSFAVIFLDIRTDAASEGSSMGSSSLPRELERSSNLTVGLSPDMYPPHIVQLSAVMTTPHGGHAALSRRKRDLFFPSGVKLCAQETSQQVIASHLSYFHLRVCQETVWEAFKVFWDRLPEQEEYQSWMSQCQGGVATPQIIGDYFSQSPEHQALVDRKTSVQKSEPTRSWQNMCGSSTPATVEAESPLEETGGAAEEDETAEEEVVGTADNDIAMESPSPPALEQVVGLSLFLPGKTYSEEFKDPDSLQYQTLNRQLTEKIEEAMEDLPGFKSVTVLGFRSQQDAHGQDGVSADYAVTVEVDGAGVNHMQMDYLTLHFNRVEASYREVEERPTLAYAASEVQAYVTEELVAGAAESLEDVLPVDDATDNVVVNEPAPVPEGEGGGADGGPEPSEGEVAATGENDVIVLEESITQPPAAAATAAAPIADGIEEEGLLLENNVQSPTTDISQPETTPLEQPEAETTPLEQPETLPEPPVEAEGSGAGAAGLDDGVWSLSPAKTEDETALQETAAEEELIVGEEAAAGDEVDARWIPEDDAEAVEEDVPPVLAPAPEVVEEEASDSTHVGEEDLDIPEVPPAEVPTEQPEDVVPSYPEAPEVEEEEEVPSYPEAPAVEEEEVVPSYPEATAVEEEEEVVPSYPEAPEVEEEEEEEVAAAAEMPAVAEEAPEAPGISEEELAADEMLSVSEEDLPEPPTAWSPERESPFTRVADISISLEIQTPGVGLVDVTEADPGYDVVHYGYDVSNHTEEDSSGFPAGVVNGVVHSTDRASIAMPANPGRALMVFFSLRVTNMIFSEDLFNKSSPEYKALEQRFLELLVPYLQSNLSNFQNLEILNFRNGSIVVNSRMKFGKPVPRGVTNSVYLILEDFCNTAYQTMNLAIDKYSLDVESGDQADPCKFQACNEYAACKVNRWSGEAECVCNAGYFSVDGLPCQSICDLQTDFCLNDGKCDIIHGQGAICRCRVGENWWYRGEHCEEYVSEPLVVGIAIASVAGFLLVASGVIFFLARTLREQYDKDELEDPIRRGESVPSLERATKYNPMYESDNTTGYSHYYRRYPEAPTHSSGSAEASTDFSSEEIRHIYENSELTKEEIQDRIRIIELYAKDRQFADFVRQHQTVLDTRIESTTT